MNEVIDNRVELRKVKIYQNIIILIMIFSPFTSLRFFRIGITELLSGVLLFLIIINNYKIAFKKANNFIVSKFWIFFIFISSLGIVYNYILNKSVSGTAQGMIFDFLAYTVVFSCCLSLETIIYNEDMLDINYILEKIYVYSSLSLFILFIISRFTNNFFGFSLLSSAGNFRPIAENIHHLGMFIGPFPFLGIYFFNKIEKFHMKIFYSLLIISNILIIFNVGSSKAIMGFFLGDFILFFVFVMNRLNKEYKGKYLVRTSIVIVLTLAIVNIDSIITQLKLMFIEADGGGARGQLYAVAFRKSLKSLLVGYGPGQHSFVTIGNDADAHSTILSILLQSGVFGVLFIILLFIKLIKVYWRNPFIIAAFCPIFIYFLGGDIMRRLPMWIFIILFFYLEVKTPDLDINYKKRKLHYE